MTAATASAAVVMDEPAVTPPVRRKLLISTAGTLMLNLATVIVNFALALVLARKLGATAYGTYVYAFAWATFLSVPASLGLTPLVIRHVAAYQVRQQWGLLRGIIRQANAVVAVAALVLTGVAAVIGWLAYGPDSHLLGPFLIGLLLVPLTSLTSIRQSAMQGLHRVVLARIPETVVLPGLYLLLVLTAASLIGHRFSAQWAIALNVLAALVAFLLGVWFLRRVIPQEARRAEPEYELRGWAHSALPLLLFSLLLVLNSQVGTILLGAMDNTRSAGIYGVASRAAAFTSFLFITATYPLYPTVAGLWSSGDKVVLQRVLTTTARLVSLASLFVVVGFFVLGRQVIGLFGSEFGSGLTSLRILAVGELVKVVAGFGGLALLMTPFERSMTRGTALGVALNVPLTALLIPFYGVNGAAVGSAASAIVSSIYVAWLAWRRLGLYAPGVGRVPIARSTGRPPAP